MTKEQFELKYRVRKVAVHCDTEEKAKALLKLAKSFGYTWISGKDLEKTSHWEDEKEHTCYRFYETFVLTSPKGFYQQNGYTIVEFELEKETTKENNMKFKVGQKVRVKMGLKNNNHYGGVFFNKEMESVVGNVFTIGSIPLKNVYRLSDFVHPHFFWTDEMLEPVEEETFKVGDVVYDKKGRKCVVKAIVYRVEYTSTHQGYREVNEITHKKPLTKITKEQLADMGYEVEE